MHGRTPNVHVGGPCGVDLWKSEPSGHAAWDIQLSRWNFAPVIINYPLDDAREVVCFAPPGASLNGEADVDLAVWRRGTWAAEWEFTAGRPPISVEELGVSKVSDDLPQDFHRWSLRETAAHVERLRAFTQHRTQRDDLVVAADRLEDELLALEPDALERYCLESSMEAARTDLLEHRPRSRVRAFDARPVRWTGRHGFVRQVALLLSLYVAYRLVRPDPQVQGDDFALSQLPFQSIPELLMWAYGVGHVALSFGVIGWVFFRRHMVFEFVRNAVLFAAGLTVIPYLISVSSAVYGRDVTEVVPAGALPTMPAMHLSVALVLGCSTALLSRTLQIRLLWVSYPLLALGIMIASGPSDLGFAIAWGVTAAAVAMALAALKEMRRRSGFEADPTGRPASMSRPDREWPANRRPPTGARGPVRATSWE
jgi:hypothetical protein